MFRKFLNYFGYYKINQLSVGGMCGCCGAAMPKHIYYKNGNDYWSEIGVCDKCLEISE